MDTKQYMIIVKDKIKTSEIMFCSFDENINKWEVEFNNGDVYTYGYSNVVVLDNPQKLKTQMLRISRDGKIFYDIKEIYAFKGIGDYYWHICFKNGSERDYRRSDLTVEPSILGNINASKVFDYIREIAGLVKIDTDGSNDIWLIDKFKKIDFVGENVALSRYLNPSVTKPPLMMNGEPLIFPFGCNNSQYTAVKNAMKNQISVIQL